MECVPLGLSPLASHIPFLPHFLQGTGGLLYSVILLLVALALMFAGRSIIKALAFIIVGIAGAAVGASAAAVVLGWLGPLGILVGIIVGFVVGGLIGLLLVHVGIGLALGYFGYEIARDLTHILALEILVGIILFVIGVIIANKILELATAFLGGVILYGVLTSMGLPDVISFVIALVVAVAGYLVQRQRTVRTIASEPSVQPAQQSPKGSAMNTRFQIAGGADCLD